MYMIEIKNRRAICAAIFIFIKRESQNDWRQFDLLGKSRRQS
jgi:hypothetical protein